MSENAILEIEMGGHISENWKFWKKRLNNYIQAADLNKKDETRRCALLLHLIGTEGYGIYQMFTFKEKEKNEF